MKNKDFTILFLGMIFLLAAVLYLNSCRKIEQPVVIDLGVKAKSTIIKSVQPAITSGKTTATFLVTPGSKYSIQVVDLKGDVKSVTSFVADNELVIKELNYSELERGDYSIILLDINGKEQKSSLTIKK